jgi:alpha-glucosidase
MNSLTHHRPGAHPTRATLALAAALAVWATTAPMPAADSPASHALASPSAILAARIATDADGRLTWSLQRGGTRLIDASPLGIVVEGTDLGRGVTLAAPTVTDIDESYAWRGIKRTATNRCRAYRIPVRHPASGVDWLLEARVFDDGFAWRYRVPGAGTRLVQGEASSWTLPDSAEAWFQTNTGDYEGAYQHARPAAIPRETRTDGGSRPVHLGPPVTVELAGGGYLLITEAGLVNYSGMTLRPTGTPRLEAAFEDDPRGFRLDGEIVSPWRVTISVPDLQALVNSDVIPNLCDPPDPRLFPQGARTDWIRPGRALITWCVFGNDGAQWHLQKWFVDQCAALHCEYLLVDAGWRTERWGWLKDGGDVWARLKELCDYAAARGVGIVVWHAYPEGRDDGPGLTRPEARRELFQRCGAAGVQGVKIDFFNSERLEVVRVYQELARLAAEQRITINFHGAHKPTGDVRTWPNEITREGIREQEYVLWDQLPLDHYAALPFTRLAVGHADFLPTYVRTKYLRNTTATFQAATAIVSHSSFVSWPDHPDDYLASPFLGLIQALPLVWDESRVLPGSALGRLAAFARRAGTDWYVGVVNGTEETRTWSTDLGFLGDGEFVATLYRDAAPHRTLPAIETGRVLKGGPHSVLGADLSGGGGFVAWIRPNRKP